ncbi:hypothetical protein Tco_1151147 [Tanacetum coccineum]
MNTNGYSNTEIEQLADEYEIKIGEEGIQLLGGNFEIGSTHNHVVTLLNLQLLRHNNLRLRRDKELAQRRRYSKDFRQNSNLEAMLKEFLVLILLFPFYFLNVQ